MTMNRLNRWLLPLAVTAIIAAYFIILFYRGFNDPDEGRYSEIPREMVATNNWLEMRMLGFRYYEKPPLAYWMVAPAIKIFGAHDWAVRVPLLFSGLLGLAILWALAVKKMGRQRGAAAVLVMASSIGFIAGNGLLLTDSFLLTFFSATCVFLYLAFDEPPSERRHVYLMLSVVAAALGFFTKGAVAIVLPAAILFIWLLWERRLKVLFRPSILLAVLFGALLILPVLWLIEKHNPGFTTRFIFEEHIARFTGTRANQLHPESFLFFFMVLPLLLLPWTLFLLRAGRVIWQGRVFKNDSFSRFLIIWAAVVICFFSAGTGKLMSYILPAIPPLGLLVGRWGIGEPGRDDWNNRLWKIGAAGLVVLAAVIVVVWIAAYFRFVPETIYPISGVSVVALIPVVAVVAFAFRRKWNFDFSGLILFNSGILLSCALLLSPLAGKDFNVLLHINSSYVYKSFARELKPEDKVVVFWSYRPALPFYTRHLYVPFQEQNELSYGMKMEPERPAHLENVDELDEFLRKSPGRVFAVVEPQDLKEKFSALNLNFRDTTLPRDPDTIIYELVKPAADLKIKHPRALP